MCNPRRLWIYEIQNSLTLIFGHVQLLARIRVMPKFNNMFRQKYFINLISILTAGNRLENMIHIFYYTLSSRYGSDDDAKFMMMTYSKKNMYVFSFWHNIIFNRTPPHTPTPGLFDTCVKIIPIGAWKCSFPSSN